MTITLAWWAWPVALIVIGFIALFVCLAWSERQGGGYLSGFFEGLVGIVLFLICAGIAGGMLLGRWLA